MPSSLSTHLFRSLPDDHLLPRALTTPLPYVRAVPTHVSRWVDWPKMLAREYDPPFKPTSSLSDGNREAQMRPVNFDAESSVAAMKVGRIIVY